MSATYPSVVLTDVCEQLLDAGLTAEQIANLSKDIPGECAVMREKRRMTTDFINRANAALTGGSNG